MIDNNMFQKNVKGYTHVNKSLFVKQPTSEVIPFAVERQLVDNFVGLDIPIKFTDINGSLYLCGSQLVDLFDVNENHIRNHLNNIYGEYLDRNGIFTVNDVQEWGGRISAPPLFLTIYQINIIYNRSEDNVRAGGGGGNQQVLFYHHDMIVELTHRLNNNRARAISQYVKNLVHDYHRNMFLVHQDIDQFPGLKINLQRKAGNFDPERHFMADVNNYADLLSYLLPDNRNPDGSINYRKASDFKRKMHTNAHYYASDYTPIQILAYRSDPNVISFGQENFRGNNRPWKNELGNACNFCKPWELKTRSHYMMTVISKCMIEIEYNKKILNGSDILKKMVYNIDREKGYNTYSCWQECPEVIVPKLIDSGALRIDFKLKVQRYYELFPRKLNLSMMEKQELSSIEKEIGNMVLQEIDINVDTDEIGTGIPLPEGFKFV